MKLDKYNKKRNFEKTKEPLGEIKKSNKKLHFVVQHHLAHKDHYDFRLEWNGVLKSWAVPKGPSYNSKDKRLAIMVEDHPLSYRNFEGVIPKGQYGGGTVMIFDEGYWETFGKPDFSKEIKFKLYGKRLKGKWALIPFKDDNWLLIKDADEYHEFKDISKIKTSIKSNKTMKEIELGINDEIILTNPDKIIYEKAKVTKEDIFNYYKTVADRMLPYLKNRIISTVRCPSGVEKSTFFKKHFENLKKYLGKKRIDTESNNLDDYYYIKDINGLLSEVQMNSYEFHIWGSLVNTIEHPDIMIFDFDPDEKLSLDVIRQGVRDLKKILDDLNIKSYLKTSGKKGYHVVAKVSSPSWNKHKKMALDIATLMEMQWPDKYTTNIRKKERNGKVFIDWIRNTKFQTSVAPYSLRINSIPTVSMPIKWSELDKVKPDDITLEEAIKRIERVDPWKDFFID